jgi:polyphenol oxidase
MPIAAISVGDLPKGRMSGLNVSANGVERLSVPGWSDQGWLWHGFSTRRGGVSRAYLENEEEGSGELNLGFTAADSPENVRENRLRFVEAVSGRRETPLATVRQLHSNISVVVPDSAIRGVVISEADGIITNQPGVLLGILTADCIPVLVADPRKRVVGAFHAGWRGTVARIVELGVGRMVQEFGCASADMIAAIGPGIGYCCYTVGDEVQAQFGSNFSYASELFLRNEKGLRLDLTEANRRQLLAAGLVAQSIAAIGGCTGCHPEYFYSHRSSGGHAGRMMAVIGIL